MLDIINSIREYLEIDDYNDEYLEAAKQLCDVGMFCYTFSPEFQDSLKKELEDVLNYLDCNCVVEAEEFTITQTRTKITWLDE